MDEIAIGLNASSYRYMWDACENLCKTRELSIGDKGIIVPWRNQIGVLCHSSVGGFFTHCGWNSMLEGLCAGLPMLTFPLLFDQFPNSKMIADDLKVGVRVKKQEFGEENLVGREEIVRLVKMVMNLDGEESRKLRARAAEMKAKCYAALEEGGSSIDSLEEFIRIVKGQGLNAL